MEKTYNPTEQYDDDDDSANDDDNYNDDDDDGRLPRWRTTKYWTIIPSRSNSPPQVSPSSFLFKRKIFILIFFRGNSGICCGSCKGKSLLLLF